jgi:hypothetical protein
MMVAAIRIWVLCSALLVSAGWVLSAMHQLNRAGYLCVFAIGAGLIFFFRRELMTARRTFWWSRWRFRHLAPLLFLLLAMLSLLGGLSYAGLNWDANAYRLPRIMHWLGAGQWHWIHTADMRLNVAGCGFEWLAAPIIRFTGTDRLLFLINWTAYLLLPGLVFSVFTRLQVRPRVAWWWMWFFPAGWCFALQAGSIANDGFAAVYALAAVDLALRAQKENRPADLWLSLLAAALATAVKQTNAPLALLWLVAAWPARRFLRRQPLVAAVVIVLGALASILPTTLANLHYSGSALPMDYARMGNFQLNPFWGIIGNAIALPAQNLLPPFYHVLPPFMSDWGEVGTTLRAALIHSEFGKHFSSFEDFLRLSQGLGITEENAGLGLGVCTLWLLGVGEAWRKRAGHPGLPESPVPFNRQLWWLRALPWALLLVFMAKVGTYENARQLAPYYAFLLPVFLVQPGQQCVVRQRSWLRLGHAVMILTAVMIILSVDRPLVPAARVCKWVYSVCPTSLAFTEYDVYQSSCFRTLEARRSVVKQILPQCERRLGYYAGSSGLDEFPLWLPLDGHEVVRVSPDDSPGFLSSQGIHSVIVSDLALRDTQETTDHWAQKFHATLAGKFELHTARNPARNCVYYLFQTNGPRTASAGPR